MGCDTGRDHDLGMVGRTSLLEQKAVLAAKANGSIPAKSNIKAISQLINTESVGLGETWVSN